MSLRLIPLAAAFLVAAVLVAAPASAPPARASAHPDAPDPLALAAAYLISVQDREGLFDYEFDFIPGKFTKGANMVRQAGAGFGLAEYYRHSGDDGTGKAVARAIEAYWRNSYPWASGRLVTPDGKLRNAKAGTTALALLAELLYFETSGDASFVEYRRAWLEGLLGLYSPGGGFLRTPGADRESPYFNGEGWLALAHYDRMFPGDDRIVPILRRLDNYLISSNTAEPNISFYHWGVMAAAMRFEATGDTRFMEFASLQTIAYLDELRPRVKPRNNTCYAVEGLAAVARMIGGAGFDDHLYGRLRERIAAEMEKNRSFQIAPGQQEIRFSGGATLRSEALPRFAGAFLNGRNRPRTRIDFTQHCLSAMIKEAQLEQDADG